MTTKYESVPNPKFTAMEWHHFKPCKLCNGMALYFCKNSQAKQKLWKCRKLVHFVHQQPVGETFYHSIMSIHLFLKPVENKCLFGEALQASISEMSSTQVCVSRELYASIQQKETKGKAQVVSEDMKWEVGFERRAMPTNMGHQQLVNRPLAVETTYCSFKFGNQKRVITLYLKGFMAIWLFKPQFSLEITINKFVKIWWKITYNASKILAFISSKVAGLEHLTLLILSQVFLKDFVNLTQTHVLRNSSIGYF